VATTAPLLDVHAREVGLMNRQLDDGRHVPMHADSFPQRFVDAGKQADGRFDARHSWLKKSRPAAALVRFHLERGGMSL